MTIIALRAEDLWGIILTYWKYTPAYALKRLLNHKMSSDITAGYIITDVERLREPMKQISDYLLKCMKAKETAEILNINQIKKEAMQ